MVKVGGFSVALCTERRVKVEKKKRVGKVDREERGK